MFSLILLNCQICFLTLTHSYSLKLRVVAVLIRFYKGIACITVNKTKPFIFQLKWEVQVMFRFTNTPAVQILLRKIWKINILNKRRQLFTLQFWTRKGFSNVSLTVQRWEASLFVFFLNVYIISCPLQQTCSFCLSFFKWMFSPSVYLHESIW